MKFGFGVSEKTFNLNDTFNDCNHSLYMYVLVGKEWSEEWHL